MERENNVLSFENIMNKENTDQEELEKFEAIAKEWWDIQDKLTRRAGPAFRLSVRQTL